MRMGDSAPGRKALGAAAAAGVRHMAHRFIVGETPKDALPVLRALWKRGILTSVDLLGEATVTQAEADRYAERCADALDQLGGADAPTRTSASRSPRSRRCCAPTRPSAARPTRRRALRELLRRPSASTRTCTSTWSRSTRARR